MDISSLLKSISGRSETDIKQTLSTMSDQDLSILKDHLDDIYYNTGQQTGLDDWEYDLLKEEVERRFKNMGIGAKVREHDNRVVLPYHMGSMDKMKPEDSEKIDRWKKSNPSKEYIIEDKLDGVSALLVYSGENHKPKLYTRGTGYEGGDISHIIDYLDLPMVSRPLVVRGELIMRSATFTKRYSDKYATARNFVSGRIGGKILREGVSDIDFVAYEIIGNQSMSSPSDQLSVLSYTWGFKVVNHKIIDEISVETLISNLVEFKDESVYEIDGIIVQPNQPYMRNESGNPKYAFAFKMRFEGSVIRTVVENVMWNVSKWGRLKPILEYAPTKLDGVTLTYATGFNAKYIKDNEIGPGTVIEVTRSGDVIPFVVKIISSTKAQFPDIPHHWNETNIDIIVDKDTGEMCVKLLSSFFAQIGVKYLGESTIRKLRSVGLDTILKIVSADIEEIKQAEGINQRSAERILENLKLALSNISLADVLGASSIFGFGIGKKKIKQLLSGFPDIFDKYTSMSDKELLDRVLKVEGFSVITAQKIVENIVWADKFRLAFSKYASFKSSSKEDNDLHGLKFVFTGYRDKKLESEIEQRGGTIMGTVSKLTTAVITNDVSGTTSKLVKAREKGVKIYSPQEFKEVYGF